MTFSEFTYWLEGLEESFENGRPSDLQWKKIKEKLNSVVLVKPPVTREVVSTKESSLFPPYKVTY